MGPERIASKDLPDNLRLTAAYLYGNRMENMGEAVVAAGETISRLMAERDALMAACEAILTGRAVHSHESFRPEWLESLMPEIRKAVAKATGKDGRS